MEQLTKNRKKKGFTLIELIAVIAIIGILAAVLVPRIVGYINDAKRSKVIAQARSVVMSYERYAATTTNPTKEADTTIASLRTTLDGNAALKDYSADIAADKLTQISSDSITVDVCRKVANGKEIATLDAGKWAGATEAAATE